ncbi:MAG: acyl-CoA dehydrogenase family protein [Hyphomicrobiaceae bacterium]
MQKSAAGTGPANIIESARAIRDLLKTAAPRIEEARELPPDVLAAMHEAKMFRLLLPASFGGCELDLKTHAEVLELVASGDASAAWVMSQGAGCAMAAAFLDPEPARRWFGPPDAALAWGAGIQGKAVAVAGGYRVSGKWMFASGSRHATLLGGHSYIYEADGSRRMKADGSPVDRTMLFKRSQAQVDDVWHVVGLRGTGSDTFAVDNLFVPECDTIDRENPGELRETGTLYKFNTTLAYGVGFSALQLGIARGMIDDLKDLALTKTPRAAVMSLRENPVFQTQIAQLEARYEMARAYLHKTVGDLWSEVEDAGGEITVAQRARLKLCTCHVINHCFEVTVEAYRAAGATAIFPTNPFERRMRDAMTASQQTQGRGTNYVTTGRVILGLPPESMVFL